MDGPPSQGMPQTIDIEATQGPEILGLVITFYILALFSVIARLFLRIKTGTGIGIDDYFIVATMVPATGVLICCCALVHYDLGRHLLYIISLPNHAEILVLQDKWTLALILCYIITLPLTKISILLLLRRIFTLNSKPFRLAVYIIGIYSIAWLVSALPGFVLSCQPISRFWSAQGACRQSTPLALAWGILNIIGDFALLVLPQPLVWRLHLPLYRKIGVSLILLLGVFANVTGILRVVFTVQAADPSSIDSLYLGARIVLWTALEPLIGILCACLPTLGRAGRRVSRRATTILHSWTGNRASVSNATRFAPQGLPISASSGSAPHGILMSPLGSPGARTRDPYDEQYLKPVITSNSEHEVWSENPSEVDDGALLAENGARKKRGAVTFGSRDITSDHVTGNHSATQTDESLATRSASYAEPYGNDTDSERDSDRFYLGNQAGRRFSRA